MCSESVHAFQTNFTGALKTFLRLAFDLMRHFCSFSISLVFIFRVQVVYIFLKGINPCSPLFFDTALTIKTRDQTPGLHFAIAFLPIVSISIIPHSFKIFTCCETAVVSFLIWLLWPSGSSPHWRQAQ